MIKVRSLEGVGLENRSFLIVHPPEVKLKPNSVEVKCGDTCDIVFECDKDLEHLNPGGSQVKFFGKIPVRT